MKKIIVTAKRYTLYMVYIVIGILWILMLYSIVATGVEKGVSMAYMLSVGVIWIIVSPFLYIAGVCRDAYYEMGGLDPEEEIKKRQRKVIKNGKKAIRIGTETVTGIVIKILHIAIPGICLIIPTVWFSTVITSFLMKGLISSEMIIYSDTVMTVITMIGTVNIVCFKYFLDKRDIDMDLESPYRLFGDILPNICILGILYSIVLCISAGFSISNDTVSSELIYEPLVLTIFTVVMHIVGISILKRFRRVPSLLEREVHNQESTRYTGEEGSTRQDHLGCWVDR